MPISKDFQWIGVLVDGTALVYGKDPRNERALVAIDLHADEVAWISTDLLSENIRPPRGRVPRVPRPFRDKDNVLIAFLSKDSPMRVGPKGELLWRAAALGGENPSTILYQGGDFLYLNQDDDLFAVNAQDGTIGWTHESRSDPDRISLSARGVLVWSEDGLNLLDLDTGKPVWTVPARLPEGWHTARAANVVGDDTVHVAGEEELVLIDLRDGSVTTLAEYEFGDNQAPTHLELVDGGVLLSSTQNIARYESDGREVFHRYYRAPGMSRWQKIAAVSAGLASGIPPEFISYHASENADRQSDWRRQGTALDQRTKSQIHSRSRDPVGVLPRGPGGDPGRELLRVEKATTTAAG